MPAAIGPMQVLSGRRRRHLVADGGTSPAGSSNAPSNAFLRVPAAYKRTYVVKYTSTHVNHFFKPQSWCSRQAVPAGATAAGSGSCGCVKFSTIVASSAGVSPIIRR